MSKFLWINRKRINSEIRDVSRRCKDKKMENLEKMITVRIMQEDAESIFSLMKTERDPVFAMEIIPYYALFIQSCQEYVGEIFIEETSAEKVKDIRNFIKVYGESFGKSKKRIELVDIEQDEQYRAQLRFDFMKSWNIHLNLGTYWTEDYHVVGNTQMLADFLGIDDIFNPKTGKLQFELGRQMGAFVASIKEGFSQAIDPPEVKRLHTGVSIDYFYDLNTNKNDELFVDNSSKVLNLFFLDLVCNMNFVKHILRPLFDDSNMWVFRVEYIVTYYTYRAIQRLKNYCDNNIDLCIDLGGFTEMFSSAKNLFQSKFRNCMMHYGIENQGVISIENIEKPFYGIVETCYNGMDYYSFLGTLRRLSDEMIDLLEKRFNIEKITLQRL